MTKNQLKSALNAEFKASGEDIRIIRVSDNEQFNTVLHFDTVLTIRDRRILSERFAKTSWIDFHNYTATLKPIDAIKL
jgi:hypothetical protein